MCSRSLMAGVIVVGGLLSALLGYALKRKTMKPQAMPVHKMGGEPGLTMRNRAFATLVEVPWEGATTLAALFEQTCNLHASQKLLGTREFIGREVEARPNGKPLEKVAMGSYVWTSYARAFQRACNFASGLVALGHQKGERCAIFAETRADWFIALQGCFRRNFTVVTIYASLGDDALVYSLNETEVTTLICDRRQMKKLAYLSEQLGKLRRVVYMEELGEASEPLLSDMPGSLTFASFCKVESLGQDFSLQPDLPGHSDIAIIMYTSGSTDLPKGVMMTHANMVATVSGILHAIPALCSKDVYMAFLPLAHVFELVAECIMCVAGASIGYGSPLTLTDTSSKIKKGTRGDASELMPTIISSVPAILDRVRNGVTKTVEAKGGVSKKLFEMAYKRRLAAIEGSWFGAWGLEKLLWDALVFKKIKSALGGRVRYIISGGAPLSRDTQRFINICIGTPIGQGYGLTETCAGATFSSMDDTTVGRVGPPAPQCYVKLINWNEGGYTIEDTPMPRGEIVIGGPNVTLGYFKNQAKTDEVYKVDEKGVRWFYTGDIGKFHPDGCLEIIDRKKDIVKLQHGEYLSPGKVEAILVGSQYVESIMVHADPFHSYAVALVVASQPALESWARDEGIPHHMHFHDLCLKDEAIEEVISSLQKVGNNAKLQKIEIPTKIKLLSEPWTPENGLVTAALKLKRENIRKAFLNDLKALYTGTSKSCKPTIACFPTLTTPYANPNATIWRPTCKNGYPRTPW